MKLWHFNFNIDKEVFPDEKVYRKLENVKRTKFTTGLGDFHYLSDFFERHLELRLRSFKYEGLYKYLSIELSNKYSINTIPEGINITIPFDLKKFKEFYPIPNLYPMTYEFNRFQHHIRDIDAFNEFLLQNTLDAFQYAEKKEVQLPYEFIKTELTLFKQNNFKREWYYQKKSFKEKGISARLFCKQNCNEFTIELIILKGRKEVFRKQIGKANPDYFHYRMLYGNLKIWNDKLVVLENHQDYLPIEEQKAIFSLELNTL